MVISRGSSTDAKRASKVLDAVPFASRSTSTMPNQMTLKSDPIALVSVVLPTHNRPDLLNQAL